MAERKEAMSDTPQEPTLNVTEMLLIALGVVITGMVLIEYGGLIFDVITGLFSFSSTGIIILLLLFAGTLAFVVLPLLDPGSDLPSVPLDEDTARPHGTPRQNRALEILATEKLRFLRAIRDMDFDYDMGKLTDDVYIMQREALIRRALAVMQRSDEIEDAILAQQDRVEAALAAFREQGHNT